MRACGECQTCCTVAEVVEGNVNSPAHHSCVHRSATGCDIYDHRPTRCAKFSCAWMHGVGGSEHRPDKVGAMFWVGKTPRGVIGFAVETAPDAIATTARDMAIHFVSELALPLVVTSYGRLPPHDVGDRLVLRKEHVLRAISMRGPLIEQLSDRVSLFHLAGAV